MTSTIAQLFPDASRSIKKDPNIFNYFDPETSIEASAAYLAWTNSWYKDWAKSVVAYNMGIGKMEDWLSGLPTIYSKPTGKCVPAPPISAETRTTISHIFRGSPRAFDN